MDNTTEETIISYDDILEEDERSLESGSNLLNLSSYIVSIKDFIADNIRDEHKQSRISKSFKNKTIPSASRTTSFASSDSDSDVIYIK